MQQKTIGLLGSGELYQHVCQCLEQGGVSLLALNTQELAAGGPRCVLLVSIDETWQPGMHATLNRYSLEQRIPWLRAYVGLGKGIIGPCVFPWESGCVTCLETRQMAAMEDAAAFSVLYQYLCDGTIQSSPQSCWLTAFSQDILTALLVEEVHTFLNRQEDMRTRNALMALQLDTLHMSTHHFLADSRCPDCQHLPADTAATAIIALEPQRKLAPSSYRVRPLTPELARLRALYADKQTGLIRSLMKDNSGPGADVTATIGIDRGLQTEIGQGHTMSYEASECAAIAEALERLSGRRPGGKRTSVRASYRQLGEQALDPTLLGLPSQEQYALPGYPYVPYHRDLVCNWVWSYSFQRQQPILVPERLVYYGMDSRDTPDRPFLYEVSNGCALGSCLAEAIFYGIQEIAERDAFLMTWYARMPMPRIDPLTVADRALRLLIERIEAETGCMVYVFNITLEQGIAAFWVMAVDEQHRPDHPRAICTAGAHLHPEKALAGALGELGAILTGMKKRYQEQRQRLLPMLADPFTVVEMEDHPLLYGLPEAFERLSFLYRSPIQQTFPTAFASFYARLPTWDLREDLSELIARYLASELDVIVVEQTTTEQRAGRFRCVKVIIPGTIPMTFGHHTRRLTGLSRLSYIPFRLGYASQPLTEAEMNPYPHPFP